MSGLVGYCYSIRRNRSTVDSDVNVAKTLSEECSGVAGSWFSCGAKYIHNINIYTIEV